MAATERYRDRSHAGRVLAKALSASDLPAPLVLGLPRGGVPVAAEVAAALQAPWDVFVVRKVGHPQQQELGVGAVAEGGEPLFDDRTLARVGLSTDDLAGTVDAERVELVRRVERYRGGRALPDLTGRTVVLVDDGLATGGTARAALHALRDRKPARLVLAVPTGAADSVRALQADADEVVCPQQPKRFGSVGAWYERFYQTSDDEVVALLAASR